VVAVADQAKTDHREAVVLGVVEQDNPAILPELRVQPIPEAAVAVAVT
jgi:hypothetical protein